MSRSTPIAIVGLGGVFPGAPGAADVEAFWRNVQAGRDAATEPPRGRWLLSLDDVYSPTLAPDKVNSRRACFVDPFTLDLDGLDIDPALVSQLDPMFHFALRAGRDAWRDAKMTSVDRSRVGVIIGNIALPTDASSALADQVFGPLFDEAILGSRVAKATRTSNTDWLNRYVAGMPGGVLAQALQLGGGSWTLDAACASSLYAVKFACDELRAGRADAMLAGGLSRPDSLYTQMGFSQLRAISPTGRCSPFDHKANGLVVGEGCGIVVLKRLDDAVRDGDHVYAMIRGIGLSNDIEGNLMQPASEGQLRAMRAAYEYAGWSPVDVDLIECHGTGTPTGDAVEFNSLTQLWRDTRPARGTRCAIGSVKSNVGHLLTAAGSAGLIKTLLAMRDGVLPPTANFEHDSSEINLRHSPFEVLSASKPWAPRDKSSPRRAAVSAFGFGGINAHVLLEEYREREPRDVQRPRTMPASVAKPYPPCDPIAIVGMAAHFGPWDSLESFQQRVFGYDENVAATEPTHWWGTREADRFRGHFIKHVDVPLGRFRIPPNELKSMLPQQLLMLRVAAMALDDARWRDDEATRLRTGVFVGIGLDLNTTNFHFRWSMLPRARRWLAELGIDPTDLDDGDLDAWVRRLRDAASPPLTADRTMGALGGIVASRIARAFRVGGPSFTVSSEETSGLRAVETAVRALQRGELNTAIVGAVDLAGDVRSVLGQEDCRHYSSDRVGRPLTHDAASPAICDGAAAVILKRLDEALRDGDRVYGVIRGIGSSTDRIAREASSAAGERAYRHAVERAWREAGVEAKEVGLIEAHGSGDRVEDQIESAALHSILTSASSANARSAACAIGSVSATIGHCGAAGGLASLLHACLALHHHLRPPTANRRAIDESRRDAVPAFAPRAAQHWLRDRVDGPRRAGVSAMSIDGNVVHVVLEDASDLPTSSRPMLPRPRATAREALIVASSSTLDGLLTELSRLRAESERAGTIGIEALASQWRASNVEVASKAQAHVVAMVADSVATLREQVDIAMRAVREKHPSTDRGVYYTPTPVARGGEIAFVFPGAGNQYAGMGRALAARWPTVVEAQDMVNDRLARQFAHGRFWSTDDVRSIAHKDVIFGQVWLGAMVSDLLRSFGVVPQAAIGYSLGETTALFATGAWDARTARDEMLRRMEASTLFTSDLAGECSAARRAWGLSDDERVDWMVAVIDRRAEFVRDLIAKRFTDARVYLLIINTPTSCVIGGDRAGVIALARDLQCTPHPVEGVTTVHCPVARIVEDAYRELHLFETSRANARVYSGAWGSGYEVTRESAAASITAAATDTLDFTRVIEQAWADGLRLFVEVGPGSSCSRMIGAILGDRPHATVPVCIGGRDEVSTMLHALARLIAEGVSVDLDAVAAGGASSVSEQATDQGPVVSVRVGGDAFVVPAPPAVRKTVVAASTERAAGPMVPAAVGAGRFGPSERSGFGEWGSTIDDHGALIERAAATAIASDAAEEAFVRLSTDVASTVAQSLAFQMNVFGGGAWAPGTESDFAQRDAGCVEAACNESVQHVISQPPALDRNQCLEFAIGSIARVLGNQFAAADTYPTRVRLPDEPLMLVDRIAEIDGEPCAVLTTPPQLTHGRVVTEHDIHHGAWYLDSGRIPTCIAVEAGQADLFLSGYLGIDLITKGLATYRLLDAVVTFHRALPGAGEVIRYDIRINRFDRQGEMYLFRFEFDATVNGESLLTMRDGCAGFFTQADLDAGKGVVLTSIEKQRIAGKRPDDWRWLAPQPRAGQIESYSDVQLSALRGDTPDKLVKCFGHAFAGCSLADPVGLPGGRMTLVHRIVELDATGGRFGLGRIVGEADIHPDDWFLTCHFVDDRVMPGTLMYECCLHTLRVLLLRWGWVGESSDVVYEPLPGVSSQLKCRGQVIETTKRVRYELVVKEIGYEDGDGAPYVLADALMYADGRAIVQMRNMSVRVSGLTRAGVEALWNTPASAPASLHRPPIFDTDRILAFAVGKPSDAFGDRYRVFDSNRVIARLPGPPYQFLDRIVSIEHCEPWKLDAGGVIEAEYDVPRDTTSDSAGWYFDADRQPAMPFAVLLEAALQPCGWLAAYLGSALTSDVDLSFRNLGGKAMQHRAVTPDIGTLTTRIKITSVSRSAGMIIQHFNMDMWCGEGPVYSGTTYFGFFSKSALANQVGIREAQPYAPSVAERARGESFVYPDVWPFPDATMRMVDQVDLFDPTGGPHGLGYIEGSTRVNPDAWFFKAHFYQDPVWPGSLGLESFIQLLKVVAARRWSAVHASKNVQPGTGALWPAAFQSLAIERPHQWIYRGQVLPTDQRVTVQAVIKAIDDASRTVTADGFLTVDGRVIYQMTDFSLTMARSRT